MKIKNLCDNLGMVHTKGKRYAREIFGHDPVAGMQSGEARELNEREQWVLYLVYQMVSELGFTVPQAKNVADTIKKWAAKNGCGIWPGTEAIHELVTPDGWEIHIFKNKLDPSEMILDAIGTIQERPDPDRMGGFIKEYIHDRYIMVKPNKKFKPDENNVRILRIGWLHSIFNKCNAD